MRKKIIGLLLALCLVVGLLPMAALADGAKEMKIRILSATVLTTTEGGTPVYRKNSSYQAYTKDGAENGTCWTTVAGDENDWNVKFEWPTGGVPTVTLKDAKLDMVGDDGKAAYTKKTNAETGEVTYTTAYDGKVSAILPNSGYNTDFKLILQGDNQVDTTYGIIRCNVNSNQYFKNVTIVGENGGKLTGRGRTFNLTTKSGYDLTIENATLDFGTATGAGSEAIPIRITDGNLNIKNSTISCANEKNVAILIEGGDLTVTDSKITATSKLSSASNGTGAICAKKNVTVSGNSELILEGKNNPGLSTAGEFNMNGGKLTVTSTQYGVVCGSEDITKINGGTVEITAKNAFDIAPFLSDKVTGVAGATLEFAEAYDGDNYLKPYILLTDTPSILPTVVPTEPPTTAPTVPAPTQAPTKAPTKAPTTAATKAPTKAPAATGSNQTTDSTDGSSADTIIYIAAAAVLVIAAAAIALILIKRKKA
ncbi:MAG: carbohydrate-binding domain-containing protein [Oscillospiraceae bacterium]|nr:carbohydrate-binding domain-containing protein [Oscillospiraceae bacterium]